MYRVTIWSKAGTEEWKEAQRFENWKERICAIRWFNSLDREHFFASSEEAKDWIDQFLYESSCLWEAGAFGLEASRSWSDIDCEIKRKRYSETLFSDFIQEITVSVEFRNIAESFVLHVGEAKIQSKETLISATA